MGAKVIQGRLGGQRPTDWADIQEKAAINCYEYVLHFRALKPGTISTNGNTPL